MSWGFKNKTFIMSSIEQPWVLHTGLTYPGIIPGSITSSSDSSVSKKSLWLLWPVLGLSQGVTQVAHCAFIPSIWKSKQTSWCFDFFGFCIPTTPHQACMLVMILLNMLKMLHNTHTQMRKGSNQHVLFVFLPSFPNYADKRCRWAVFY